MAAALAVSPGRANVVIPTTAEAKFADRDNGDYTPLPTWAPVVDQGENKAWMAETADIAGNPRIFNAKADVGAFECQTAAPVPEGYSPGVARAKAAGRPVRLLVIGNSFSYRLTGGGTFLRFGQTSRDVGHDVDVVSMYRAGATMGNWASVIDGAITNIGGAAYLDLQTQGLADTFAALFGSSVTTGEVVEKSAKDGVATTLREIIGAVDWDVVTIQQSSGHSGGDYDTFWKSSGETLLAAIRSAAPNAEIKLHQTWSYDRFSHAATAGNAYEPAAERGPFGGDVFRRDQMYDRIAANVKRFTDEHAADNCYGTFNVIPVGYAVQHYRYNKPVWTKDSDPTGADGQHISNDYLYLQMVVWLKHFWNLADAGIPTPAQVKAGYTVPDGTEAQQKASALAAAALDGSAGSSAFDYYGQGTVDYSYGVTFRDGYTETPVSEQSVTNAACATVPTAPTRKNFTFLGWSQDGIAVIADATINATPVHDDATYTALWQPSGEPTSVAWVAEGGSDATGDGTYEKPYATVTYALNWLEPGGTVYVKAGTIAEGKTIVLDKAVTLAGDPAASRESVIISGGGAYRVLDNAVGQLTLSNLTVADGKSFAVDAANIGGGLRNTVNGTVVTNCVFTGNVCGGGLSGSVYYGRGSAIGSTGGIRILDCEIRGNGSDKQADACYYGAVEATGALTIDRCVFKDNRVYFFGAAISTKDNAETSAAVVSNTKFFGHEVGGSSQSDAVVAYTGGKAPITFRNCLFAGNGTNAYNVTTAGKTATTLVRSNKTGSVYENCTFVHNGCRAGSTTFVYATSSIKSTFRNCLFHDNYKGTNLVESLAADAVGNTSVGLATDTFVTSSVEAGARFADATHGDCSLNDYTPENTWLTVVDKGTNQAWMDGAADLAGRARLVNGAVDLGAYENATGVPMPEAVWIATDGDDAAGDGTAAKPYATVGKALEKVAAGGTVFAKAGVYAPTAQIELAKDVAVAGDPAAGRDAVVFSGGGEHRVFLVNGASVTLSGLTVTNGKIATEYYGGGGASCQGDGTLVVTNCVFTGNVATNAGTDIWRGNGGAISCCKGDNGGKKFDRTGTVRIYDSVFSGNSAKFCAGAAFGATEIVGCRFAENNVTAPGSSVGSSTLYLGADATVRNCLFAGNGTYGGTTAAASYNLIGLGPDAALVESCTFVSNGTHKGVMKSCLIFSHKTATDMANPSESNNLTVRNCLFNDNTVGTSTYTTLFGDIGKVTLPALAPSGAKNADSSNNLVVELAADAQFKDAAKGDYTPKAAWTAVVDAGTNQAWMAAATDLAGRVRVFNGTVDLGAYENTDGAADPWAEVVAAQVSGVTPENKAAVEATLAAIAALVDPSGDPAVTASGWLVQVYGNAKAPAEKLANARHLDVSVAYSLPVMACETIGVEVAAAGGLAFTFTLKDGDDVLSTAASTVGQLQRLVGYCEKLADGFGPSASERVAITKAGNAFTAGFVTAPDIASGFMTIRPQAAD